jgi:hypothetical protein
MNSPAPRVQARRDVPADATDIGDELIQRQHIDIDEVFTHHIGEMGPHQMWLFCVASVPWFAGAFLTYNMAFAGAFPSRSTAVQHSSAMHQFPLCSHSFENPYG